MMTILGSAMMVFGALLGLLSGLGVARLPSTLARIHAAAKPASLGLALVASGAGLASGSIALIGVALLVVVFQFLTAPIAGHLLGRSVTGRRLPAEGEALVDADQYRRRWPVVLQTALVWIVLWRDLSAGSLLAGLALGLAVSAVTGPRISPRSISLTGALKALGSYALSLLVSNLRMARQVLAVWEGDPVETVVVCDLETRLESVAFFDANAISFSPGTLTLELSDGPPYRMVVHALGQDAVEVNSEVAELEDSAQEMYR